MSINKILYRFKVLASNNSTQERIMDMAHRACLDNASFHGWAPGFVIKLDKPVEIEEGTGKKIYSFVVEGDYELG